jgi:streptomycin 6-kinase
MKSFHLHRDVAARILSVHGERGAAWLLQVPELVAELASEWALVHFGPPFTKARASLVIPAQGQDGTRLVLKVAPLPEWLTYEAHALAHWAGGGAVRLKAADLSRGALLLERAIPGTPLAQLCTEDDRAATVAASTVIVQLRSGTNSDGNNLPSLASWTQPLASGWTSPTIPDLAAACQRAGALATELLGDVHRTGVLHGDLHHENLLRAEREPWLAIDPKGLHGPLEAESAALLRNPRRFVLSHPDPTALILDRLDILAERLGEDVRRLAGWGYVLAVVAAVWAFEDRELPDVHRWLRCSDLLLRAAHARGGA